MKKPIIGISGSVIIDGQGSFAGYRRSYVNEDYVNSVIKNGGVPYIIPFSTNKDIIKAQIENIDGLILSGGHDVSPRFYDEEPNMKIGEIYPDRDVFDFTLIEFAKEKKIPILGICRGFQVMNVYHGGSLFQDLTLKEGVNIKHNQVHSPTMVSHNVMINEGTKLHEIFNKDNIMVNSFHHQIINQVAPKFKIGAVSFDNVVEAIEHESYGFMVGVQWHPEMLHVSREEMNGLFSALIDNTKKQSKK